MYFSRLNYKPSISPINIPFELRYQQPQIWRTRQTFLPQNDNFHNNYGYYNDMDPNYHQPINYVYAENRKKEKRPKRSLLNGFITCCKDCKNLKKEYLLALFIIFILILIILTLVFVIIYILTANTASIGKFCIDTSTCLNNKNLECVLTKCSCKSGLTWNSLNESCSTINVNEEKCFRIKNTVNSSIFQTGSTSKIRVTSYAGKSFRWMNDLAEVQTANGIYYYLADDGNRDIVILDQNGNYISHRALSNSIYYIEAAFNSLFYTNGGSTLYQIDYNLNTIRTISGCSVGNPCINGLQGLSYDSLSNLLYVLDGNSRGIHVFNSSIDRVEYIKLNTTTWVTHIKVLNCLFYISSDVAILVVNRTEIVNTLPNLCSGNTNVWIKRFSIDASGNIAYTCSIFGEMRLVNSNGALIGSPVNTYSQSVLHDSLGRLVTVFYGVDIFY